jgi:hypothetical protein
VLQFGSLDDGLVRFALICLNLTFGHHEIEIGLNDFGLEV